MALADLATYACEGNDFIALAGRMFVTIYAWVPTAAGAIVLLFAALHRLLRRACARTYGASSLEQQLVTATHALFTALYAVQAVPYTYLVCRILFADNFLHRRGWGVGRAPQPAAVGAATCHLATTLHLCLQLLLQMKSQFIFNRPCCTA